jgi:hypothetical protein
VATGETRRRWWPPTLIELMIVAAIVGLLAAVFMPVNHDAPRYLILNMHTAYNELERLSLDVARYRDAHTVFPRRNEDLGWPKDGLVQDRGRHVYRLLVDATVQLQVFTQCWPGEKHCEPGTQYEAGQMSYRPVLDGQGSLAFVCGNAPVPPGFRALGENRTTLTGSSLPGQCR